MGTAGDGASPIDDAIVAGSSDPPAMLPMTQPARPASNSTMSDTDIIMRRMSAPFGMAEDDSTATCDVSCPGNT